MLISETKNGLTTIRFHDEYYCKETKALLSEIDQIVSQAYQRRMTAESFAFGGNLFMDSESR